MKNSGLYYKQLCEELAQRIQLLEAMLSKKKKKKKKSKLDPVGKEDEDIDNDGKSNTSRDKYLKNRREQIDQAMKDKKKTINEGTVVTDGYIFYGGFPRKLNEQTKPHGIGSFGASYPSKEFAELHKRFTELNAHHQLEPNDPNTKAARDAALREVLAHPDYDAYDQSVNRNLGINEDRAALELAAMNPSGAYTPTPKTMKQRKKEEDEMTKASRVEQEKDYYNFDTNDQLAVSGLGLLAAAAPTPFNLIGLGGAASVGVGMYLNRLLGADAKRNDELLQIEKIRKTAPAQPEDYAKAAREAAERRKQRGIQTYD